MMSGCGDEAMVSPHCRYFADIAVKRKVRCTARVALNIMGRRSLMDL